MAAQDARVKKMMKLCGQDHCSDGGEDSYETYLQIFQQCQAATLDVIAATDAGAAVVTAPSAAAAGVPVVTEESQRHHHQCEVKEGIRPDQQ